MSSRRQQRDAIRCLLSACVGNDLEPNLPAMTEAAARMGVEAWSRLPGILDTQGITLQAAITLSAIPDAFPESVRNEVRERALAHRATSLYALIGLERLASVLKDADIEWAVFKGPILADTVYRTPGRRSYSDVDVLIHPRNVRTAIGALESAGLTLLTGNWKLIDGRDAREVTFAFGSGATIDLHWYPLGAAGDTPGFTFNTDELLSRTRRVVLGSQAGLPLEVQTFSAADQLVHLAVHAIISGMGPMRYALDLEQCLIHDAPDAAELASAIQRTNTGLPLAVAIDRASGALPHVREVASRIVDPEFVRNTRAWLAVTRKWSSVRPPQTSHESVPLDFLLACTRENSKASLRAMRREITLRVAALTNPRGAVARLREGSQRGFSPDPFLDPVDEGYREKVLNRLC